MSNVISNLTGCETVNVTKIIYSQTSLMSYKNIFELDINSAVNIVMNILTRLKRLLFRLFGYKTPTIHDTSLMKI